MKYSYKDRVKHKLTLDAGPPVTTRCHCCQMESSANLTPATNGKVRGMKKYQAVIRLNNSVNTSSYSDVSTLNLTNLDESKPELDLTYNGQAVTTYYTIDSRRLGKHQKNQEERKLLHGIKHFNLNVQKGLKILQEGGFVDKSPESVAIFLFRQERLSKKQIGAFWHFFSLLIDTVHIRKILGKS